MKKTRMHILQKLLTVLLLPAFIPVTAAQAQLTLFVPTRDVSQYFSSGDSLAGPYFNTFPGASTNGLGLFSINQVDSTPGTQTYVSATATCLQNSTISSTSTSLSVTGQLQVSASGSASEDSHTLYGGDAVWQCYSRVQISFTITQPFSYSLQATTTLLTNTLDNSPAAFVALGHGGTFTPKFANPDIAAYGSSQYYGYAAPTAGGSNSGVLPAGLYEFHAECYQNSGVDPAHSPTAENFTANFTLNVTAMPQPPVIMALTPNGAGTFLLTWTAPQTGSYRVMSSTNLTDWLENIPAANLPSGLNTNIVSQIPGSIGGFFRIQYLP